MIKVILQTQRWRLKQYPFVKRSGTKDLAEDAPLQKRRKEFL